MSFIIVLAPPIPEPLKLLLSGYLDSEGKMEYVSCAAWDQNGSFVHAELLPVEAGKNTPWAVQLPLHLVLAVADFSPERRIGFHSQNQ